MAAGKPTKGEGMITVRWKSELPDGQYEILSAEGTWGGITREEVLSFPGMTLWNPQPWY
jgi:hypothetical protein